MKCHTGMQVQDCGGPGLAPFQEIPKIRSKLRIFEKEVRRETLKQQNSSTGWLLSGGRENLWQGVGTVGSSSRPPQIEGVVMHFGSPHWYSWGQEPSSPH